MRFLLTALLLLVGGVRAPAVVHICLLPSVSDVDLSNPALALTLEPPDGCALAIAWASQTTYPGASRTADTNCDGVVTERDIDTFVVTLINMSSHSGTPVAAPCWQRSDFNHDGAVTSADVAPFVAALLGD